MAPQRLLLHAAVRVQDRQGAVRLGRYMIRCPMVLQRLGWSEDTGEVLYNGRPRELELLASLFSC